MTREDVFAFFKELEPAERALKAEYLLKHGDGSLGAPQSMGWQDMGAALFRDGITGEDLHMWREQWTREYHPHPLLAKLAHSGAGIVPISEEESRTMHPRDIYLRESAFSWETLGELEHSMRIVKHCRYLPGEFHEHEYIEISYVHSGSCRHVFEAGQGHREVELLPGDLVIIPPGMRHKVEVFNDGVMLNILVEISSFRDLFLRNLTENPAMLEFFLKIIWKGEHSSVILLHTRGDGRIADTLADLVIYYVEEHLYANRICEHILGTWLLLVLPYCTDTMELFGNASGEGELAVSIVGYLQTHYMDTSLEEVAKKFHYSVSHVNRILKKYTGTTVLKYVRYLKIHHACELLAKTNYTVEEISNYAGYADTSYFIEQFRKEMQTTPLKYRKKIMEK